MKAAILKSVNALALFSLGVSYCLFIYMFVSDDTFLDNWVSRLTAIVNVSGAVSAVSLWKFVKKLWPYSLWTIALVILMATGLQALALLPLHRVIARVEIIGGVRETGAADLDVSLRHAGQKLMPSTLDTAVADNQLLFRSDGTVLIWNKREMVVAVDRQTKAADSSPVVWSGGSIWDAFGEREVRLQLRPGVAMVSIIADPPTARLLVAAYSDQASLEYPEYAGNEPLEIAIGDRIRIVAWDRGFDTLNDNYGLQQITGPVEIPILLRARPTEIVVEAYNIGEEPESTAYVVIDSELTTHRAFERFSKPWGRKYTIAVKLVISAGQVFQSEPQSVTLVPDRLNRVKCILRAVR